MYPKTRKYYSPLQLEVLAQLEERERNRKKEIEDLRSVLEGQIRNLRDVKPNQE